MNAIQLTLVHKYDTLGMSLSEIQEDHNELDPLMIKATLMSCSAKYREDNKDSVDEDISDPEYQMFLNEYKQLALNTDVPQVKERALKFLINEKKGRNDLKKMLQDVTRPTNFIFINENLLKARNAKLKALGLPIQEITDVEAEKVA